MNWAERRAEGNRLYEILRKASEKWKALPPEEQARQIAERKIKEDTQEYLTRVGSLEWWAWMIDQGYDVQRPPNPGPDPRIKKGEVIE